jgi:hypothetical protein
LTETRLARYAPLTGIVWVAGVVASFLIGGDTPDTDSSTAKVVHYWTTHDSKQIASSIVAAVAVIFLIWFASSLREALKLAQGGNGRLPNITFAGAVIFAAGLLVAVSLTFAVADTAGDVPPQVTQSLFVMSDDMWLWFPVSSFLLFAPSALVILRTGLLPAWFGWVTAIMAIALITPVGFFVFFVSLLWIVVVSVILFRRQAGPPVARPAATGPATPD